LYSKVFAEASSSNISTKSISKFVDAVLLRLIKVCCVDAVNVAVLISPLPTLSMVNVVERSESLSLLEPANTFNVSDVDDMVPDAILAVILYTLFSTVGIA
jgi:hypothetical protein